MSKILCIGGPADGMWIEDYGRLFHDVIVKTPASDTLQHHQSIQYHRERFSDKYGKAHEVLVHGDLNIVVALIENYRPGTEITGRLFYGGMDAGVTADDPSQTTNLARAGLLFGKGKLLIPPVWQNPA